MGEAAPGTVIDGFRLGEMIHVGSMASIFRLEGRDGPLPLIMKIPRLGPGERSVTFSASRYAGRCWAPSHKVPIIRRWSLTVTLKRRRISSWNSSTASG